jgi:predicted Zn-dependent peptidase
MKPTSYKLKNGLIINHFHTEFKDIFRMEIIIRAGSLDETKEEIGFMHFLEHLMSFFPSDSRPDSLQNQHELGNRGIDCNAWTGTNNVGYYLEGLSKYQDLIIEMMMDNYICRFKNTTIFDNLFKQEVNAVISELYAIIDDTDYALDSLINFIRYPNTNLAITTKSEKDNVKIHATIKKVLDLRNKWYIPELTNIMIISKHSDVQFEQIVNLISSKYFPVTDMVTKNPDRFGIIEPSIATVPKYKIYYINPQSNSNSVNISIQFPIDLTIWDNEDYALTALSSILTNGMSSRLYFALRSHLGAVYGVQSALELDALKKEFGNFYIYVETSEKKATQVIDYILVELQQLLDEEISDNELIRYRETITLEYNHAKNNRLFMSEYDEYVFCLIWGHKTESIKDLYDKHMKVTKENIINAANKFLDPSKLVIFYSSDKQVLLSDKNKNTYLEVKLEEIDKL